MLDDFSNRVVIDTTDSAESKDLAENIMDKHPANTVVFKKLEDGSISYSAGQSVGYKGAGKDSPAKIYVLHGDDQSVLDKDLVRSYLFKKFGHDFTNIQIKPISLSPVAETSPKYVVREQGLKSDAGHK